MHRFYFKKKHEYNKQKRQKNNTPIDEEDQTSFIDRE